MITESYKRNDARLFTAILSHCDSFKAEAYLIHEVQYECNYIRDVPNTSMQKTKMNRIRENTQNTRKRQCEILKLFKT